MPRSGSGSKLLMYAQQARKFQSARVIHLTNGGRVFLFPEILRRLALYRKVRGEVRITKVKFSVKTNFR